MFTGIVERTGKVVSLTRPAVGGDGLVDSITQLIVDAGKGFETKPGDSIAVNGCCLTVTRTTVQMLAFDVSRETLGCTSLGGLFEGTEVNLERALKVSERLGGHIVSGHVDGLGVTREVLKRPDGWEVRVGVPPAIGRFMIPKGSVCLDGVSLTINEVIDNHDETRLSLMLIPTTVSLTSLKYLERDRVVNVEVDMIAKWIERLATPYIPGRS